MNEIRLFFGKPVIRDRSELISVIRNLQTRYGCVVQALDADKVVSERHISFATEKAFAAFSQRRNVAKDTGMEIIRYASGERQIERALCMGISDSTKRIALILASLDRECIWPNISDLSGLIELDGLGCSFSEKAVKKTFNITTEEMEAVGEGRIEDLVIERVALADTYR
jgi:KEOPS complex subunit Cgi121